MLLTCIAASQKKSQSEAKNKVWLGATGRLARLLLVHRDLIDGKESARARNRLKGLWILFFSLLTCSGASCWRRGCVLPLPQGEESTGRADLGPLPVAVR